MEKIANKIFSGVNEIYRSISPINSSGVNDVIVVKDKNGDMRCSPFQLKFPKLHFHGGKPLDIHLYVNNRLTDIQMSITSKGNLYFNKQIASPQPLNCDELMEYLVPTEEDILSILKFKIDFTTAGITLENMKFTAIEEKLLPPSRAADKENSGSQVMSLVEEPLTIPSCQNATTDDQSVRNENLLKRVFIKNRQVWNLHDGYLRIVKLYPRMAALLASPDHLEYLLSRQRILYLMMMNVINAAGDKRRTDIAFSASLNMKTDGDIDRCFSAYRVSTLDNPENLVVRLETVVKCEKESREEKKIRFYMPYILFTRLFFEMRSSKNQRWKLMDFLEYEYNSSLGWNIFGKRKTIEKNVEFTLQLDSKELDALGLEPGKNPIVFKVGGQNHQLSGNVYLWDSSDRVVVTDFDGTITKSDILGHVCAMVGVDWTHTGVAALFSQIVRNGYKIIYLSARPLSLSQSTRTYINGVSQGTWTLPDGPVIVGTYGILESLYREVVIRCPERYKIEALGMVKELFHGTNPFAAGFGNKVSDVYTYKAVGIANNRIYTINSSGKLLAEYTKSLVGTYHTMNEFIDSIFPAIKKTNKINNHYEYSDFGYWGYS